MFYGAPTFNQFIGGWDVSHMKETYMFYGATSFDEANWLLSSVEDESGMFGWLQTCVII
jgi:Mycoplasma protein of unknown function, DUF285